MRIVKMYRGNSAVTLLRTGKVVKYCGYWQVNVRLKGQKESRLHVGSFTNDVMILRHCNHKVVGVKLTSTARVLLMMLVTGCRIQNNSDFEVIQRALQKCASR